MRVNFLMQVNGFLYYVTIHGCTHIVMRFNFLMQVTAFFSLRHCSWIHPYHDAGQFSDASQRFFVLRHHSWIYPYRDASQFSDASERIFFTTSLWPKAYLLRSNFEPKTDCSKLRSYEWRDNRQRVLMFGC